MRIALPIMLALALSACGGDPVPGGEAPTSETPLPVEPDGGIGDGAGPPQDAAALSANAIPNRYLGVWDYEGGTCARESDMRMEISGKEILFYESIGTVIAIRAEGDDIVVTLAMEGEGETWQQQTRFSLSGEGDDQRLSASDGAAPKVKDEYPSKRCPI